MIPNHLRRFWFTSEPTAAIQPFFILNIGPESRVIGSVGMLGSPNRYLGPEYSF
jgi:hypothetical protein